VQDILQVHVACLPEKAGANTPLIEIHNFPQLIGFPTDRVKNYENGK